MANPVTLPALLDAIRVRPNWRVMELLRRQLESLEDMAISADDRMEADGLKMLIDMNDAIGKALAQGDAKITTGDAVNGR